MRSTVLLVAALLTIVMVAPTTAQSTDIDLKASDGVTLKATYTSPGRPGPAMLLVHQCNMDRSSRSDISKELLAFARKPRAAITLTIDVGLATAALALLTFAIATGPLSLTSAISGSTPLILFFATVVLARKAPQLLGESLNWRLMTQKLIAAALVVSGLGIIALA